MKTALWAYRTTFKTSIQSTPFRMAFGLEAVMPIEFQVPSLRVQVKERLLEAQSEQYQLEQLLELGNDRIASMAQLEQCQRQWKAFVDRHRKGLEKELAIGKPVRASYDFGGPVPSGLLTSLTERSGSAHLPEKLSRDGPMASDFGRTEELHHPTRSPRRTA